MLERPPAPVDRAVAPRVRSEHIHGRDWPAESLWSAA